MTMSCDDTGMKPVRRFEVFTGAGRRREWSNETRAAIIAESYSGAESVSAVPTTFRVLVTRRPRYGCRTCEAAPVQAAAPHRIIEGGLPTEALVAHVLVSKYADHLPLYRQAQIYARQGITLDRSTLADWVRRAAWWLTPLRDHLLTELKRSPRLFADETTAPVLDPGRGRTKTGQLWAYARDDRPWGGADSLDAFARQPQGIDHLLERYLVRRMVEPLFL